MLRIAHHLKNDILWFEVLPPPEYNPGSQFTGTLHQTQWTLYNVEGEDRIYLGTLNGFQDIEDKISGFVKGYENAIARNSKANPPRSE
jgi:hypothetical protein